ncbi:hypothetical protein F4556_004998 [Kitasatospora gansuensis]|uniref:Uncharacterized protein n=1 Tax=Kitasatospora gansuensis TaxID=258050 RepID=A0A7W7SGF2_9ACTN|nr:hypothetical protein [Kitasatospora gansuensis]MBB4949463.1 hypothetical protein [Kitasatospora gansuensis]
MTRARGWAAPPGSDHPGAALKIAATTRALYQAAADAELPLPLGYDSSTRYQLLARDNALATTLAVYAVMTATAPGGQAHVPGGPSIGTVIGGLPRRGTTQEITAIATMRAIEHGSRQAMSRLIHDAARARGSVVDLRTVAVLAFAVAGSSRAQQLTTNPTGHWLHALDGQESWTPVYEVSRDFTAAMAA